MPTALSERLFYVAFIRKLNTCIRKLNTQYMYQMTKHITHVTEDNTMSDD